MDSRERVRAAFGHREPDRVPMDISATPEVWGRLREHFGARTNDGVRAELGIDFRYVAPEYTGPELERFEDGSFRTVWGDVRTPVDYGSGHYDETTHLPLADARTAEEVAAHWWPSPDWYDYGPVRRGAERHGACAVVCGGQGVPDFINGSARLRGMERVLTDLALGSPVTLGIFERRSEFYLGYMGRHYEAADGLLDILYCGDDYGTQRGLTISPGMFREHFAPRWVPHVERARERGLTVMLHSCGSTRELMEDFVGLGFDVLDTVQPEAAGMDPAELKRGFGGRLAFHGMISSQGVLPRGTERQVRDEVRRVLDIMAPGGGYALAPTHNIQPDTPLENVLAMYDECREYGVYGR